MRLLDADCRPAGLSRIRAQARRFAARFGACPGPGAPRAVDAVVRELRAQPRADVVRRRRRRADRRAPRTGRGSPRGCRSAASYDGPAAGRWSRRRGARPTGACCSCARAASPMARLAGSAWGSPRPGSATCRDAPRRAGSRSSASLGAATTRHARPTRPRPSTPHGSSARAAAPSSTGGDRPAVDEVLADPRLPRLARRRPVAGGAGPAARRARAGRRRRAGCRSRWSTRDPPAAARRHPPAQARPRPARARCGTQVAAADVVVHAGDWVDLATLRAPRTSAPPAWWPCWGNNDGPELRERLPEVAVSTLGGLRFEVVHETGEHAGSRGPVRGGPPRGRRPRVRSQPHPVGHHDAAWAAPAQPGLADRPAAAAVLHLPHPDGRRRRAERRRAAPARAAREVASSAMWEPEPGWVALPGGAGASTVGVWRTAVGDSPVVVKRLSAPLRHDPGQLSDPRHFAYWRREADVAGHGHRLEHRRALRRAGHGRGGRRGHHDHPGVGRGRRGDRALRRDVARSLRRLRPAATAFLARGLLRSRLAATDHRAGGWPTLARTTVADIADALWARRGTFLDALDALPQVPQHGDPTLANVPGRRGRRRPGDRLGDPRRRSGRWRPRLLLPRRARGVRAAARRLPDGPARRRRRSRRRRARVPRSPPSTPRWAGPSGRWPGWRRARARWPRSTATPPWLPTCAPCSASSPRSRPCSAGDHPSYGAWRRRRRSGAARGGVDGTAGSGKELLDRTGSFSASAEKLPRRTRPHTRSMSKVSQASIVPWS